MQCEAALRSESQALPREMGLRRPIHQVDRGISILTKSRLRSPGVMRVDGFALGTAPWRFSHVA